MSKVKFGPFCLDFERRELLRLGVAVPLGGRAIDVLCALVTAKGDVVPKGELLEVVWPRLTVEENNLQVQISAVRKALENGEHGQSYVITVPGRGYRFIGIEASSDPPVLDRGARKDEEPPDKPSIAVLPFANLSDDADQEYFADGISEDIITALTRYRWFFVTARNSSFVYKGRAADVKLIGRELGVRYVLEGSVRRSAHRARITAQLVEASTGNHIWAERYDREIAEVFAIQDEIAERVAGAIEPELLRRESERAAELPVANMRASDLVRRGTWYFHQLSEPTHLRARELFREAVKLDPQFQEAHVWLSRAAIGLFAYGWTDDPTAAKSEAIGAAKRAIQLDEKSAYAHFNLSIAHLFSGSLEQAARFAERAVELSASFALGHLSLGMARLYAGRASQAVGPLERGLQLNPYDPQNSHWFRILALAFHFLDQDDRALEAALKAVNVRPSWPLTLETLAVCYASLNQMPEARDCMEQMRQLEPPKGDPIFPLKDHNPAWAENIAAMLRRIGSP
jgi:TolB-like protein/Tfp pilus assembly protein PilF